MSKSLPASKVRFLVAIHLWLLTALGLPIVSNAVPVASAPVLLCEANSTRAVALEAVTFKSEPFPPISPIRFGPDPNDRNDRIILFAKNLVLLPGDGLSVLTVEAEDASRRIYPLTVEYVGKVPGSEWMSSVTVRLNGNMASDLGDVLVRLTFHGISSNRVRIGIGHVGDGPPDDEPSYVMPYVLEFDGSPQTVDYGDFWPPDTDLGKFFWEFWAMPGANADARYLLTDGYGGAHALLFGFFRVVDPVRYSLYGNIYDGTNITTFASDDGPAAGEWGHFAVGWDGRYVITYLNGVPVGRTAFAGPRRTPGPASGGGRLLIGGSDHNNLIGRIAEVRGYEGIDPLQDSSGDGRTTAAFAPETLFGVTGNGGHASSFLSNFLHTTRINVSWTNASGVSISQNNLRKTTTTGWNAGASSAESIRAGDGYAEFTATETNTHRMFGLNNSDTGVGYTEIDYAIHLNNLGGVAIFESGISRGLVGSYLPGDRFRVAVKGGVVSYLKNGKVFYTSGSAPTYPLWVDTSLYSVGATITDAVIVGETVVFSEEVMDIAGGRVGRLRGVGFGILDPRPTYPLPQFVVDPNAPNAATLSGEGVPFVLVETPDPLPAAALVFDSFSRKPSTFAFDNAGGLGSTEGGSAGTQAWRFSGPNETSNGPTIFGILNGRAVILSNGPGIAWVPTGSATGDLDVRVNRRAGPWGSGVDTGICFRVLDGTNFFFAYTSANEDEPASRRLLTVGYWLNGIQKPLALSISMPTSWTTLRVIVGGDNISVFADETLVYSTTSSILTNAQGAGLYNNQAGMALTNRWDNFTVLAAP